MIRVAILLFLCVIGNSNEDGDWLKCKPKPGCSIARCDPPPGHWFENLDKLNDYSILCQPSDDTDAATNYGDVLEELTKLKGRLERSKREGSEMRVEMKILERENSRMKNQMEKEVNDLQKKMKILERENSRMKNQMEEEANDLQKEMKILERINATTQNQIEEMEKEVNELRKEMKMLEKENARMKSQMEEIESRNEKDSFFASLTSTEPHVLSTKDLTTSPTTETTTKVSCVISFNGICYWTHVEDGRNVKFTRAEEICSNKASTLAYFPSERVYNAVVEDVRSKIPSGRKEVFVWTGVIINTNTGNVIHPSGDTYVKWYRGYPHTGSRYETSTRVALIVNSDPGSTRRGMFNYPPHQSYHGVVCQIVE